MDFQTFKANIEILDKEKENEIREKYIDKFINTAKPRYGEMIEQRHKFRDGYCYLGYLWDYLKNPIVIKREYIEEAAKNLDEVYVFWDIQTCERIFIKDYWKLGKETVLRLKFKTLLENYRYLPEDIYIFDDTFSWTLILTHEEVDRVPYCVKSGNI